MQLRKTLVPVVVLALVMGFAGTAAAQVTCEVASASVARGTSTGLTEPVGDISFTCTSGGSVNTDTATLTVAFGLPITNDTTHPITGIALTVTVGTLFDVVGSGAITVSSIDHVTGDVLIELPAVTSIAGADETGNFVLSGVLVSLVGAANNTNANISITNGDEYFIAAGQTSPRVISDVTAGLADIEVDDDADVFADGTFLTGAHFDVTVTEAYIDMLRWWSDFNSGDATYDQGTQVLLSFTGIPAGLEIKSCAISAITGFASGVVVGNLKLSATTIDADDNTITVTMTSTSLTDITDFTLTCDDFDADDDDLPFATGTITAKASLGPDGDGLDGTDIYDDATDEGEVPRYNETFGNSVTVATIIPATTTLLINYAAVLGDFDTGVSIANTTADPFGDDGAGGGQSGTITFYLFPTDGDMVEWETSDDATIGTGSDAAGLVKAGNNYTVNISEILTDKAFVGDFLGYVFIETGFTHGHGYAAVYGTDFSVTTQILVLANPLSGGRATAETLGN